MNDTSLTNIIRKDYENTNNTNEQRTCSQNSDEVDSLWEECMRLCVALSRDITVWSHYRSGLITPKTAHNKAHSSL